MRYTHMKNILNVNCSDIQNLTKVIESSILNVNYPDVYISLGRCWQYKPLHSIIKHLSSRIKKKVDQSSVRKTLSLPLKRHKKLAMALDLEKRMRWPEGLKIFPKMFGRYWSTTLVVHSISRRHCFR